MKNSSFLGVAEARVENLREVSHHLHGLNISSASLREIEHEIPELEVAMAVYRRLNAEGADTSDLGDSSAFLNVAENRVDHLRQLSNQMHALDWVHASLTDVDTEIPELELSMTVYTRLTRGTDGGSSPEGKDGPNDSSVSSSNEDDRPEAPPAPSFSQFALHHLDPAAPAAEPAADPNGSR